MQGNEMAKRDEVSGGRLPVNFHQTFVPERPYLTALLQFAAEGGEGTEQEISQETGIPTGKHSGKVPATLNYGLGMGLLRAEKGTRAGTKKPVLTEMGQTVIRMDPHLREPLTQWLLHLHLCRAQGGAEVWHLTFGPSMDSFGMSFSEEDLEAYLASFCGRKNRSLVGPLVRTYEKPVALRDAEAITRRGTSLLRTPAPLTHTFRYGYAYFILALWESHFPDVGQVTLTEFEAKTFWKRLGGWNDQQCDAALALIQETGALAVDRQNYPWVLTRRDRSLNLVEKLYSDLT